MVIVALVGFAVATVGAGCGVSTEPDWSEAESAISSLPVPAGYTESGLDRRGAVDCAVEPSCGVPAITRTLTPTSPRTNEDGCATLHTTLPAWMASGYGFERWGTSATTKSECLLVGTVNGHSVVAEVTPAGAILVTSSTLRK